MRVPVLARPGDKRPRRRIAFGLTGGVVASTACAAVWPQAGTPVLVALTASGVALTGWLVCLTRGTQGE